MNNDCIFCKIISGEIPSKKVYEDETVYAFEDIAPVAPVHILVVPKMHIANALEITEENSSVIAHIYEVIGKIAREKGIESFRVVNNCGEDAGQTVFHLHFHIIGGRKCGIMA